MKTLFGKLLARIRLENNMTLKDMAHGVKVPSSYLSAVESNSKKLTPEFLEKIVGFIRPEKDLELEIRKAAILSTGECLIDTRPLKDDDVDTLTMFAKRLGDLSEQERNQINEILIRGG